MHSFSFLVAVIHSILKFVTLLPVNSIQWIDVLVIVSMAVRSHRIEVTKVGSRAPVRITNLG
jgi:hypothetical protein